LLTAAATGGRACRQELFLQDYATINWNKARNQCAAEDLYYPHSALQNALWWSLYKLEGVFLGPLKWLRRRALKEVMKLVTYEDENTRYIDIGPVNKALNMLCCWFDDPDGAAFKRCGGPCGTRASDNCAGRGARRIRNRAIRMYHTMMAVNAADLSVPGIALS
jgi:hypothetical protein